MFHSFDYPETPFVVVILIWGPFIGIWLLWNKFRQDADEKALIRSLAWPETQGAVISSRIRWAHVEVMYGYSVAGTPYTGTYNLTLPLALPTPSSQGARIFGEQAERYLTEFPPQKKIIVRFNPVQPSESVLFRSAVLAEKSLV